MDVFKFIDAKICEVLCDTPRVGGRGTVETSMLLVLNMESLTFDIMEKDGPDTSME